MELTRGSYVILGMLSKGGHTGYEIKQLVDISTRYFWVASYGQIYPELRKLEQAGLIEGYSDPAGGRPRRVYELTAAGREALHEWLTRGEGFYCELRHEGVLRFFFADALELDEQLELLRTIRGEHQRIRDELADIGPAARMRRADTGEELPLLTLEWGIAYQDFFLDWCSRVEQQLVARQRKAKRG